MLESAGFSSQLRQPVCLEITTGEKFENVVNMIYRLGAQRPWGLTILLRTQSVLSKLLSVIISRTCSSGSTGVEDLNSEVWLRAAI